MNTDNWQEMAVAIERELKDQGNLYGIKREVIQRTNLIIALREIMPTCHTDLAFVVWAGSQGELVQHIVKEYYYRRAGFASELFDHPLLALQSWCMPDTCRLLVFREQLETLAKQLTGSSDGRDVVRGVYRYDGSDGGISLAEFSGMIDSANGLTDEEISKFYDYLRVQYGTSLPFTWCSTIVERALLTNDCPDKSVLTLNEAEEAVNPVKPVFFDNEDPQYDAAVALVTETGRASVSMIQRRLRISFARADIILDKMEHEGLIGPDNLTLAKRKVFINMAKE